LTDLHSIWHDDAYWPSEPGVLFTKVRTPDVDRTYWCSHSPSQVGFPFWVAAEQKGSQGWG